MKKRPKIPLYVALLAVVPGALVFSAAAQRSGPGRAPLTVLQSSRRLLEASPGKRALAAAAKNGQYLFSLGADGSVTAFDRRGRLVKRITLAASNAQAVAVGLSNNIYLVSAYAPRPYVARFTEGGGLVKEFAVDGDAVAFQMEKARGFLSERGPDVTGV